MEEIGQDGATTPPMEQRIGDVQRQELLAAALSGDDTPAAGISVHNFGTCKKNAECGCAVLTSDKNKCLAAKFV